MNINHVLRILQDARHDIELVRRVPRATWRAEYGQVLEAFAVLDDWISQGRPLPTAWAAHHAACQTSTSQRIVPRPRQEPRP